MYTDGVDGTMMVTWGRDVRQFDKPDTRAFSQNPQSIVSMFN